MFTSLTRAWQRMPVLQFVVAALVMIAATAVQQHYFPADAGAIALAGTGLIVGPIRQFGKSYQLVRELARPQSANQPESIPHVFFDHQQYAQAGSATLSFFNGTAANATNPLLSNFANGTLQAGNYFEVHRIFVTIDSMPAAVATAAVTGPAQDVEILHKTAQGILSWNYKTKPYGGYRLGFFGRPGGPLPDYRPYGSGAVANNVISSGQTETNGGFPVLGNLILAPSQQFTATMAFSSTAISAATYIGVHLMGIWHRTVG